MSTEWRPDTQAAGPLAELGLGGLARARKQARTDFSMSLAAAQPPEAAPGGRPSVEPLRARRDGDHLPREAQEPREALQAEAPPPERPDRPDRPAPRAESAARPEGPKAKEPGPVTPPTQEAQVGPEAPAQDSRTEGGEQAQPQEGQEAVALAQAQAQLAAAIAMGGPCTPVEATQAMANHLASAPGLAAATTAVPQAGEGSSGPALPAGAGEAGSAFGQALAAASGEAATKDPQALIALAAALQLGPAQVEVKRLRTGPQAEAPALPPGLAAGTEGGPEASAPGAAPSGVAVPAAALAEDAEGPNLALALLAGQESEGGEAPAALPQAPGARSTPAATSPQALASALAPEAEGAGAAAPSDGEAGSVPSGPGGVGGPSLEVRGATAKVEAKAEVRASELVAQVAKASEALKAQASKVLTIQLSPEHLGKVEIRLVHHQGQVSAELRADSASTQKLFESQAAALAQRLGELGVKVDRVEVATSSQQAGQDLGQGAWSQGGQGQAKPEQERQASGQGGTPSWARPEEEVSEARAQDALTRLGLEAQFEAVA